MGRTQQTFVNKKDGPIYVSIEPWPECFELEPGDRLTIVWDAKDGGDTIQVDFINDRELVIEPWGPIDEMQFLLNGEPARAKSWDFRHR
jgi:hypothetical protein